MRDDNDSGRPNLLWLLLAALAVPAALIAYQEYRPATEGAAPPQMSQLALDATRVSTARVLAPDDPAGLSLELTTLRGAVQEERARLVALRQARDELAASADGLRLEVAALEQRRDGLAQAVRFEAGAPATRQAEAAEPAPEEPARPRGAGDAPWTGTTTGDIAAGGGGRGGQGDAEPGAPEIVIHHRAGSAPARRAAELVAEEVRRAGFSEVTFRPMRNVPRSRTVRTFRPEDAPAGERMAARFRARWSHPWEVEASRAAAPPVGMNMVEIWLPH
jgi:hypothetical protein